MRGEKIEARRELNAKEVKDKCYFKVPILLCKKEGDFQHQEIQNIILFMII